MNKILREQHDLEMEALNALVVNNPDLEKLEALLEQFNIFEALNAVQGEVYVFSKSEINGSQY